MAYHYKYSNRLFAVLLALFLFCLFPVCQLHADSDLTAYIQEVNTWKEGSAQKTQYSLTVSNNGSNAIDGWTVELSVPDGSSMAASDGWNGSYFISDGLLTIKAVDYNKKIEAGSSVTDVGFIISTPTKSSVEIVRVVAGTTSDPLDQSDPQTETTGMQASETPDLSDRPIPLQGDDYLTTDGNKIIDQNGNEVWLTGINWFGYNTGTNIFDGVWSCNMEVALEGIANHGFNLLRIPISSELLLQWKENVYPEANYNQAYNSEFNSMNSLEILDYAVSICAENGIKIMFDIHSAQTDAMGHMTNLWYTENITVEQYYESLEFLVDHYKNDDTVIAIDLKNEPHGKPNENGAIWNDSTDQNNWKHVAETAGNLVLDINANLLIMIEGIEIYPKDLNQNSDYSSTDSGDYHFNWWGGNLRGVRDYPIDFGTPERNAQIVYSPHDYGPDVYQQPWFSGGFTYESLHEDCWNDNWLYIHNDSIAPLLIGEWGGFMQEPNLTWMTYLRQLIKEERLHHTFWCYNANSGDTGGLVGYDFITWDEEKYDFVREVLWQEDGYFVGLDHEIPLGKAGNGISLKSVGNSDVTPVDPSSEEALVSDASEPSSVSPNPDVSVESSADDLQPSDAPVATVDASTWNRKWIGAGIAIVVTCSLIVVIVYFFKQIKRNL